jgi:hypothetical protein
MLDVRRTSASNLDIERIDAARLDPHQRLTFTGSWPHDCDDQSTSGGAPGHSTPVRGYLTGCCVLKRQRPRDCTAENCYKIPTFQFIELHQMPRARTARHDTELARMFLH